MMPLNAVEELFGVSEASDRKGESGSDKDALKHFDKISICSRKHTK